MNRTTKYKIGYFIIISSLIVIIILLYYLLKLNFIFILIVSILFLIPGRIQGFYFKEFYKARVLISEKKYIESVELNLMFIQKITDNPIIKKLILFSWGIYTRDIEAMTYNNIGSAFLENGNFDKSELYLNKAISLDKLYAIPYFNLAVLSEIKKDREKAIEYVNIAKKYGFSASKLDLVFLKLSELNAKYEFKIQENLMKNNKNDNI